MQKLCWMFLGRQRLMQVSSLYEELQPISPHRYQLSSKFTQDFKIMCTLCSGTAGYLNSRPRNKLGKEQLTPLPLWERWHILLLGRSAAVHWVCRRWVDSPVQGVGWEHHNCVPKYSTLLFPQSFAYMEESRSVNGGVGEVMIMPSFHDSREPKGDCSIMDIMDVAASFPKTVPTNVAF